MQLRSNAVVLTTEPNKGRGERMCVLLSLCSLRGNLDVIVPNH